jgi:hypothetical protein
MSAVGFATDAEDSDVKKLREACGNLNSVLRDIKDAQIQINALNLGLANEHLKEALLFARRAKAAIAEVGKDKKTKGPAKRPSQSPATK